MEVVKAIFGLIGGILALWFLVWGFIRMMESDEEVRARIWRRVGKEDDRDDRY